MIDLHSHILPGVDDGAATLEVSVEMARSAVADGIDVLVATPHVRADYPTTPETMERLLAETHAALAAAEVPLELRPGGELGLDALAGAEDAWLRRFTLGGGTWLLLEFPYHGWPQRLHDTVAALASRGFSVLLAHPERNAEVQSDPGQLRGAVDAGALVQLTAASVDGRLGRSARAAAHTLLDRGLAHVIASDGHAPALREIGMRAAAATLDDERLARWLTTDVPAAILDRGPIPSRPSPARRRLTLPRLRR